MAGGAERDHPRAAAVRQQRPQQVGEREVAEVVGGELRLPARPHPRLRAGHDRRVVDEDVDAAPVVEHLPGERPHAVERAEVELADPRALDPLEHLGGVLRPPGRDDHLRARAAQRAHGLQPEARVAAGDDREATAEVDALEHLGRRRAVAEAGADRALWRGHDLSLRSRSDARPPRPRCGCGRRAWRGCARRARSRSSRP